MQRLDIQDPRTAEELKAPALEARLPGRRAQVHRQRLVVLALIFSDVVLAFLMWGMAFGVHGIWGSGPLTGIAVFSIAPDVAVWIGLRALLGLYPGYGLDLVEELRRQTYAVAAALAIITTFALAFKIGDSLSRLLLISSFLGLAVLAPPARHLVKRAMMRVGLWGKPVAILGADETAETVVRALGREWELGLMPAVVFDDRRVAGGWVEGVPYGGDMDAAPGIAAKHGVETAILAMPRAHGGRLTEIVDQASSSFRSVIVIPDLGGMTNSVVVARDLAGIFGVEIKQNLLDPWARRTKRALDLFGAVVGGLLISPFLLGLVLLIKLDSPGPAFYAQQRLGAGERYFRCWKFRTMCLHAERALNEYLQDDPDLHAEWERSQKLREDPRITRVGHFLRETSLDELPQLYNVLRGEMSLVGPRPIVDAEVPKYGGVYGLYRRVTPGISGFWQVGGRSNTTYEERVAMDAYYVRNWSVWLDFVILARTIGSVLFRRGAR
jgi:Undecaprenyl-phosphate galactose phosphotransferase WbaP